MEMATVVVGRRFAGSDELLGPYVPTLIVDWLRDLPGERYRSLDCTLAFADISGFTRMTDVPRTATVTATTQTRLWTLSQGAFLATLRHAAAPDGHAPTASMAGAGLLV